LTPTQGILAHAKTGIIDLLPTIHGPARLRKILGMSRSEIANALCAFGIDRPMPATVSNWERRERIGYDKRFKIGADAMRAYRMLVAHVCEAATDGEWTAIVHGRVYWRVELREVRR